MRAQAVPTPGVASGTTTGALAIGTPGTGYRGGNGYGIAPGYAGMASSGMVAGWGGHGIAGTSGWAMATASAAPRHPVGVRTMPGGHRRLEGRLFGTG